MKNAFKAALAMLLAVSLTACQQQSQTEPKTLKDAILMESDSKAMSFNEDYFVYVYKNNGEYTRVYGKISKELYEAINAVFLDDPDYKKTADLLATVKIEGSENLSANMPKEDDLKEYIGKTGQDLLDEGFTLTGYITNGDAGITFFTELGDYEYHVMSNEVLEDADKDDFDYESAFNDIKIDSIEISGISMAATDVDAVVK